MVPSIKSSFYDLMFLEKYNWYCLAFFQKDVPTVGNKFNLISKLPVFCHPHILEHEFDGHIFIVMTITLPVDLVNTLGFSISSSCLFAFVDLCLILVISCSLLYPHGFPVWPSSLNLPVLFSRDYFLPDHFWTVIIIVFFICYYCYLCSSTKHFCLLFKAYKLKKINFNIKLENGNLLKLVYPPPPFTALLFSLFVFVSFRISCLFAD